ncbi:MAG TPA: hypothetical protein VFX78_08715 [Candidatus Eisenbacteria bacterium]|nr:hypothetical protein [Candidatus Eisenbacteria bacterium]
MTRPSVLAAFAALLWAVSAMPARALPLYASREGTKCASCHFDPNGGGMRNEFGFSYLKNRHSMEEETKFGTLDVDPQLNQWIRLGVDMRMTYIADVFKGGSSSWAFFPMQANLRFAVTPFEKLAVVGSHGITVDEPPGGFPPPYVAREFYALFHDLPKNAFVQFGRFRVPFGLRQDDHTSFTRTFLPYDSQKEDAGIALGSTGKNGWFEFSYTNGEARPTLDQAQAFAGKVAWAFPWLQGGVSGYLDMSGRDEARWSLYLTRTFHSLTLLGEYAGGTDEDFGGDVNSMAGFVEGVYRVSKAVNVRAKYDYVDPDKDRDRTVNRRYLLDVDVEPVPFTQVKLSYARYHPSTPTGTDVDYDEYMAMLYVPF